MLNRKVYSLPVLEEHNFKTIEQLVLDLQRRYRENKELDDVELTWLDQANNWLDSTTMSNS